MDAVILCGGQSRRMGRNKAFLPIVGRPLIERQIEVLRRIFERLLLVTRTPLEYEPHTKLWVRGERLKIEIVPDAQPGRGAMVGIYSGLLAVQGRSAFFVACDMPFLNEGLIRHMIVLSAKHDVVIPQSPEGLEPTHAAYSKTCIAPMQAQMAAGDLKIINFFPQVNVCIITEEEIRRFDPSGLALVNINTEEEYKRYCAARLQS